MQCLDNKTSGIIYVQWSFRCQGQPKPAGTFVSTFVKCVHATEDEITCAGVKDYNMHRDDEKFGAAAHVAQRNQSLSINHRLGMKAKSRSSICSCHSADFTNQEKKSHDAFFEDKAGLKQCSVVLKHPFATQICLPTDLLQLLTEAIFYYDSLGLWWLPWKKGTASTVKVLCT